MRELFKPPFRALKILILLGCLARVAVIALKNPLDWLVSDGMRHWENGELLWRPGVTQVFDPLLYQIWIAFFRGAFGESRLGVVLSTSILSLSLPFFWHLFARRLFPTGATAWLTTALICWTPTLMFNYAYFLNEALFLPVLGCAFWLSMRYLDQPTLRNLLLCALGWGLAMQTRTFAVPVGFVSLAYCCLASRRYIHIVPALVTVALLAIPQTVRGSGVLNYYYPFASSPFNRAYFVSGAQIIRFDVWGKGQWEFSSPSFYFKALSPFSDWSSSRHGVAELRVDPANGRADWDKEYMRLAKENLNLFPGLLTENAIFLLFGHSWPEGNQETRSGLICLWSRWLWGPLVVFNLVAGLGFVLYKRTSYLPFITATAILILLVQPFGVAEGRYRKPLEPLLIVATAFFARSIERSRRGTGLERRSLTGESS